MRGLPVIHRNGWASFGWAAMTTLRPVSAARHRRCRSGQRCSTPCRSWPKTGSGRPASIGSGSTGRARCWPTRTAPAPGQFRSSPALSQRRIRHAWIDTDGFRFPVSGFRFPVSGFRFPEILVGNQYSVVEKPERLSRVRSTTGISPDRAFPETRNRLFSDIRLPHRPSRDFQPDHVAGLGACPGFEDFAVVFIANVVARSITARFVVHLDLAALVADRTAVPAILFRRVVTDRCAQRRPGGRHRLLAGTAAELVADHAADDRPGNGAGRRVAARLAIAAFLPADFAFDGYLFGDVDGLVTNNRCVDMVNGRRLGNYRTGNDQTAGQQSLECSLHPGFSFGIAADM